MTAPLDPALVWSRALGAGGVSVAMGIGGHLMADGLLPGVGVLIAIAVLGVVLAAPVMARPIGVVRSVGLVVGGQTLVHLTLTVGAGHRGDPGPVASGVPHGAAHGPAVLPLDAGRRIGSLQDAYAAAHGGPTPLAPRLPLAHLAADLSAHAPMMAAHLAAAVVVGLWLAWGERALGVALTLLAARLLELVRLPGAVVVVLPGHRTPSAARIVPLLPQWRVPVWARRGPPVVDLRPAPSWG